MFKRSTWHTISLEEMPKIRRWIRFWDCAATDAEQAERQQTDPDWTVGLLLGQDYQDRVYVVDVIRERLDPGGVEELVRQTAADDGRGVSVRMEQEGGSSGKAVIATFARRLRGYDFEGVPPSGDKEVRAKPVSAAAKRGEVFLVDTDRYPEWYGPFMRELEAFPAKGVHDDQVDGLSGAYNSLSFRADVGSDLAARNNALAAPRPIRQPSGGWMGGSTPV
jgi:predicted phage terminase large subunit-like protein